MSCSRRGLTHGFPGYHALVSPATREHSSLDILDLHLPPGFPEKYRNAVVRTVNPCATKKHLLAPPKISVVTALAGQPADTTLPALGPDSSAAPGAALE